MDAKRVLVVDDEAVLRRLYSEEALAQQAEE
jgi:hypothetical protein